MNLKRFAILGFAIATAEFVLAGTAIAASTAPSPISPVCHRAFSLKLESLFNQAALPVSPILGGERCCTPETIPNSIEYGGKWCEDGNLKVEGSCFFRAYDVTGTKQIVKGHKWRCDKNLDQVEVPSCQAKSAWQPPAQDFDRVVQNIDVPPAPLPQLASKPSAPRVVPVSEKAAVDRTFGRQKFTVLGMHNRVKDLYRDYPAKKSAQDIAKDLGWVEESVYDWSAAKPNDPEIPKILAEISFVYHQVGLSADADRIDAQMSRYFKSSPPQLDPSSLSF